MSILVLLGMYTYFDAVVVFVTSQTLLFRSASVHENKKPHECPICDSKFSEKGDLKRHIETVHEKKQPHKAFQCSALFVCRNSGLDFRNS